MKRYNPKEIEPKWQKTWAGQGIYRALDFDESRPKFVMLTEFPYPSGDGLHMGHIREYTLGDILARYKRMTGYNVLYPMAYDAFGLPTENFAIKNKVAPQVATETNAANFQEQFESLGYSIDWSRSFKTTDPDYYKWTQWLFLQFFNKGLAYQEEIAINWCPKCKTGLANEEVVNGTHERCDTPVEKKELNQWLLRITDYADRLIDGLETVDYPSRIADQQINWIGRSRGAVIKFKVEGSKSKQIEVFTTRPDTLFGATFMVLAPEHDLVEQIATEKQRKNVEAYVKQAQAKSEIERQDTNREKTGVFTGAYAINPISHEKVPIWIADYVLSGYGTGAIMAVPAHDERDHGFAKKFDLPIIEVVQAPKGFEGCYTGEGEMVNSGEYNGISSSEARDKIVAALANKDMAEEQVNYRLRDWIFSRQHYWGEPIPIIHCKKCGAVPVPDSQLPVKLPPVEHYEPTDSGESPLAEIEDWVSVDCPKCGGAAKRETDTMPNWAGSSWYYLRYYDAHNDRAFADKKKLEYWGSVDLYLGGMEHTTLHLLYSRFWHQFFYDIGLVPTPEPYLARRGQGIILAEDGSKMSKSKGNIVNPNEILDAGYGADALRLAITFLAPYDQTTPWSSETVGGTHRFVARVWSLVQEYLERVQTPISKVQSQDNAASQQILRETHKTIKKVSEDLHEMNFNTAIAALMEYTNALYKIKSDDDFDAREWRSSLATLLQLLAPFAPHIAEELWHDLGYKSTIHTSDWPVHDDQYLIADMMNIVVQVNGKVRANISVAPDADKETILQAAKTEEKVASYLKDQHLKKSIYVSNKLVNFVV
ncbi:MAG: leucine--tRNA ligase [Candidatus Saccharibacteria bacterium]|nr:leucine--tRNA ligase [Candidatus Saccharibacteria bacterium]